MAFAVYTSCQFAAAGGAVRLSSSILVSAGKLAESVTRSTLAVVHINDATHLRIECESSLAAEVSGQFVLGGPDSTQVLNSRRHLPHARSAVGVQLAGRSHRARVGCRAESSVPHLLVAATAHARSRINA